jgi:hypothetical protein
MNTTESTQVDVSKAGALAQQIVTLLQNEAAETRRRAVSAAMMLMGEASIAQEPTPTPDAKQPQGSDDNSDIATFFNHQGDLKPADYAHLCAAFHYSTYGTTSFSGEEIRAIALEAGVVVPDRLDKTFTQATRKGKKLYQAGGKGEFKPTAAGSLFFKEEWGVKPGRGVKASVAK